MAIHLYTFHKNQITESRNKTASASKQWTTIKDEMVKIMRLKHLSMSSEKTYIGWIRSVGRFLSFRSPEQINGTQAKAFLTWLAVERRVSASTQSQAFHALLFLFRHVLNKDIGDLREVIRSPRRRRMPVVLTRLEIEKLFEQISGTNLLAAELIYGCGLRLRECVKIRIKDIDFERRRLVVMGGKGYKDRQTLLPECLWKKLHGQIEQSRLLFKQDRSNSVPGVELPHALERKYPNAGKEWAWQWLFPSW